MNTTRCVLHRPLRLAVALAMLGSLACSGSPERNGGAQGVVVTLTPESVTLVAGSQLAFTASVSGTADSSTTWSVAEGSVGGSITAAGAYTAPSTAGSYHVVATSKADPRSSATAAVTVTADAGAVVTMTVSPVAATISAGTSQAFSCAVGGSADTACTWSVQEGASGGTVTAAGVYTAPQAAGVYHLVATSHSDPTQHAVATVTVAAAAPQAVTVSLNPMALTLASGGSQAFTCTVTGSSDTACTWSVQEGTSGGAINSAGTYVAPQTAGTYHVVAKSHADSKKSATAVVTVTAPPPPTAVAVSPTATTLVAGASQTFSCTVTGSADAACTWAVQEGSAGGTISSGGVYAAPSAAGTYHVVATSHADSTKSATAVVTVTASPVAVAVTVSPLAATLVTGTSQTFTCTITGSADTACTWSVAEGTTGGSVTTGGTYTAPQAAGTYHVVATSHADSTKSAAATVTVTSPPVVAVAISPTMASVDACQTYTFRAAVTGSSNTNVTWSVTEGSTGGSVSSSGVYTAPSTGGTYHVVAKSQADPTKSQSATVTVSERIVSVSVTPATLSVTSGGTAQFTATVTTTCGTFTQSQALTVAGGSTTTN